AGDTGLLAEELGHHRRSGASDRERRAVVAVAGVEGVAVDEGVDRADRRGLLADRQMAVAADPGPGVLLLGSFLEPAAQRHLPEEVERVLSVVQNRSLARRGLRHIRNTRR